MPENYPLGTQPGDSGRRLAEVLRAPQQGDTANRASQLFDQYFPTPQTLPPAINEFLLMQENTQPGLPAEGLIQGLKRLINAGRRDAAKSILGQLDAIANKERELFGPAFQSPAQTAQKTINDPQRTNVLERVKESQDAPSMLSTWERLAINNPPVPISDPLAGTPMLTARIRLMLENEDQARRLGIVLDKFAGKENLRDLGEAYKDTAARAVAQARTDSATPLHTVGSTDADGINFYTHIPGTGTVAIYSGKTPDTITAFVGTQSYNEGFVHHVKAKNAANNKQEYFIYKPQQPLAEKNALGTVFADEAELEQAIKKIKPTVTAQNFAHIDVPPLAVMQGTIHHDVPVGTNVTANVTSTAVGGNKAITTR